MAFYTTLADVHKNRTLKPRYARTQATPQGVELASTVTAEVFPGMCLTNLGDGTVKPSTATLKPSGLCGTWSAELEPTNARLVAMWVPGSDAILEVHAPAFDASAAWTTAKSTLATGAEVLLRSNADGKLTIADEDDEYAAFRLVGIEGTSTILVAGLL